MCGQMKVSFRLQRATDQSFRRHATLNACVRCRRAGCLHFSYVKLPCFRSVDRSSDVK